jgi:hypothetical protein
VADDDIDSEGLEERHEDAPQTYWKWWGRCDGAALSTPLDIGQAVRDVERGARPRENE